MFELRLLFLLAAAASMIWLLSRLLLRPRRILSLEVAYVSGFLAFQLPGYLRETYGRSATAADDRFILSTLLTVAAGIGGFWLWNSLAGRGGSTRLLGPDSVVASEKADQILRLSAVVVLALVAKNLFLNPFEQFDVGRSKYLHLLANLMIVPAALVASEYLLRRRKKSPIGLALWLVAMLGALVSGSRTPGVYALFGFMLLYLGSRSLVKRRPEHEAFLRILAVGVLPVLIGILLVFAGLIKVTLGTLGVTGTTRLEKEALTQQVGTFSYSDVFENTCLLQEVYPDQLAYEPGSSLWALVVGPVPRSLWPEKPRGLAYRLAVERRGPEAAEAGLSLAPGLVGELWVNGGWLGIAMGGVFLAFMSGGLLQFARRVCNAWRCPSGGAESVIWTMTLLQARGDFYTITVRGGEYLAGMLLASIIVFGGWPRSKRLDLNEGSSFRSVE